jgi:uncharacterized protein (TIGR03067 family)
MSITSILSVCLAVALANTVPAETQTASSPSTAEKELVDQWEGFVSQGDGSNPRQHIATMSLTITPGRIDSTDKSTIGQGTYRITGNTGNVHNIDATGTSGRYAGKHYQGIFTIEGNTLKWCAGDPGRGRPNAFRTNPSAGYFLMVLTRKQ